jgi:hypothetical protein
MENDNIDWSPVVEWFGYKPKFHDAEVVSIELYRSPAPSIIRIHTFTMTSEVDEKGYFVLDKHAIVTFKLTNIEAQNISAWNHQNALMGLDISVVPAGHRLEMEAAYGVDGYVVARHIDVEVQPVQKDDIYKTKVAGRS